MDGQMTTGAAIVEHRLEGGIKSGRSGLLNHFVELAERIGRPIVLLCPRIAFARAEIDFLLAHPLVRSIILVSDDAELPRAYPGRVGFLADERSVFRLPQMLAEDIVVVGRWSELGARAAWTAWRSGMRRLHIVQRYNPRITFSMAGIVARSLVRTVFNRVPRRPVGGGFQATRAAILFRIEQTLFSRRLRTIETSPLPVAGAPADWRPGRIVMVGGSLGPGGAERQLAITMLGLDARGYRDIQFLHYTPMLPPSDFFLPPLTAAGIPAAQVDLVGYGESTNVTEELSRRLVPLGEIAAEIGAYAQEFLDRRPAVVHIWLDYMNVIAGLAALLVGVPRIVLSCRSLSPENFVFLQPYMRPIYRLLAQHPSIVFLNNSRAGADDYKRWLDAPNLNIHVIRNGFDPLAFPRAEDAARLRTAFRREIGIPAYVPVIGSIMRMSEEKRPDLWIDAAMEIARRMPDAHFLLIGGGPMREEIEMRVRPALNGRIHFPGHRRDVVAALAAMDIFLLTSRVEGLPNVLIESQFMGVPVVTVDRGGAKETLNPGVTGIVVQNDNPVGLADAVVGCLSNPDWMAHACAAAPIFAAAAFGIDRMIDESIAVYDGRQPA